MPNPKPSEDKSDFIDRCIPVVIEDGTAEIPEQAVAICNSIRRWQKNEEVMAESLIQQERHRWSYMTENQLTTRLKRITRADKLHCFIQLAIDNNHRVLEHLATERLHLIEDTFAPQTGAWIETKKKKTKKLNTCSQEKKKENNIRTVLF